MFQNPELQVKCPGCGATFKAKLYDMHHGKIRQCPRCRKTITFTGNGARQVEKSLGEIEKAFKSLDRKITIKI